MDLLKLKVITPRKIVLEETVSFVTVPTVDGEITILPKHVNLFALLGEGIVRIKSSAKEDYLAIGGGYLETNGEEVHLLVSRAYKQEEIDQEITEKAINEAQKTLSQSRDLKQRQEAGALLRRSLIDLKLIKKRRPRRFGTG